MGKSPPNFIKMTESVFGENEVFCKSNEIARKTWTELVELMNEAIDMVIWEAKLSNRSEVFSRYAMLN